MFVHHWQLTVSALHAVTTAVLQTLPRFTAVKQRLTFLVSQGCSEPNLNVNVRRQLLCSKPSGTLSVTTTSSAAQLPLLPTVITYCTGSPGQASSGPHFSHVKTGFAQSKEQKRTGVAVAQKHAHCSPSHSHFTQILPGRHSPFFIGPMFQVTLRPSTFASGWLLM